MIRCSWETLPSASLRTGKTFAQNDPQLPGMAGAISVQHTHSRRLDYHPQVHGVMPAATIDADKRRWRTKRNTKGQGKNQTGYLFNHQALAKVFRAKLLDAITQEGPPLPVRYPETWVVDVKSVGSGDKALVYLGRYLYNGVIQKGYYRLPGWPGHLPLPRLQN
jgi:hypothetical protein